MNKAFLIGRPTRDPETRQAGEITVTRFNLAVDRRYRKAGDEVSPSTDFISCVAFGKTAEFISKYFKQGVKMAVEGRIQTGSYTNKEGVKIYTTDVVIEAVEFAESKKADAPTDTPSEWLPPANFEDDLPFK